MSGEERWCVVTGGRGFAARHLVEMLIKYDMFAVRIADLPSKIDLQSHEENGLLGQALRSGRAQYVSTDLRHKAQVLKALEGVEVVFHMAAPNSSINNYQLQHSVNVQGTKNVIEACTELKVKRLIYTSSPSVVFDGIHAIFNGNESLPYPDKHNDSYSATKALGEALVVKSNGVNGLLTCCIRPSSIFVHNGDGNNCARHSLLYLSGDWFLYSVAKVNSLLDNGYMIIWQAYFITNLEPIKFWEFVSLILEGLGYQRPKIKIPAIVVMPIAHIVEWTYRLLGPYGMKVPQLTPSRVRILTCSRSFDCSRAKDQIGYTPIVSLEDGLRKTIESFSHLRAECQPKKGGPSKASVCLGRGKGTFISFCFFYDA
ncbi:hypothetical protein GOBAR_DD30806 [Gossypium barbadense]|nr:hypothetical protein GOBAR_DD30806 [Gossypium barbadense]